MAESIEVASRPSPDDKRIVEIQNSHDPTSNSPLPKVFSLEYEANETEEQMNGRSSSNRRDDTIRNLDQENAVNTPSDTNTNPTNSGYDGNGSASSDSAKIISLDELKYGFSSYHAIFTPVSITMILSALAVGYIQGSEQARNANEEAVTSFYTAISMNDSNSASKNFGLGLLNGLIMIGVLTAATFLIVILYKYRCMKCLMGYMIVCSAMLLGVLGGVMFETFITKYGVVMDEITFYFLIVNFAAVGTIAVFYGKGIPMKVTQAYLVFTSVILAWQLSFFDDLMAWILLVLLALYDLCAVLTPCGPLKALVNLMQSNDAPALPGFLYEARLPEGVERPGRGASNSGANSSNQNSNRNIVVNTTETNASTESTNGIQTNSQNTLTRNRTAQRTGHTIQNIPRETAVPESYLTNPPAPTIPGVLPFAIAKIYKLPISMNDCPQFVREKYRPGRRGSTQSQNIEYSAEELVTEVTVLYNQYGGRILVEYPETESSSRSWRSRTGASLARYIVKDANGNVKRILVMNEDGRVFEERTGPRDDTRNQRNDNEPQTIKLGLGDFIFYSVLVAKASANSFTTFAACMLVILAGLGGTLVLLSVYHSALPALPISIFLGVVFFFTTRALIEPWIEIVMSAPFYV